MVWKFNDKHIDREMNVTTFSYNNDYFLYIDEINDSHLGMYTCYGTDIEDDEFSSFYSNSCLSSIGKCDRVSNI